MKRTTYSINCIILMSMLMLGIIAGLTLVTPAHASTGVGHSVSSVGQPVILTGTAGGAAPVTEAQGPVAQGDVGSGWKKDYQLADNGNTTENPSTATFINSTTGAVTLYTAMQRWDTPGHWILRIYRSDDGGNTWYWWFWWAWTSPALRSMINPSIAVNPWSVNGSVFVAVQSTAYTVAPYNDSNDIDVVRVNPNNPNDWQAFGAVDTTADEVNPHLVSEYGWAASVDFLCLSYETGLNVDFRSIYFAKSTNYGQTWTTLPIAIWATPTYSESCITYAQGNIYIAYRESQPFFVDTGWINVAYSSNDGNTWSYAYNVSGVSVDASWPTIAGAHNGVWYHPTSVIMAYEYNYSSTDHDIYYAWSVDAGTTWVGGNDSYHAIATSTDYEQKPELAVDGTAIDNQGNVGGNYHLVYFDSTTNSIYYTQLPVWDIPIYYGGHAFVGYYFGWTIRGQVTDTGAEPWLVPLLSAIATYERNVGGTLLWEPVVSWSDYRIPGPAIYGVYSSIPNTDFSITFVPSSQTVEQGKSISYYVTVNLISGPTNATAYLNVQTLYPSYVYQSSATYDNYLLTPTGTAKLTLTTSNLLAPGTYQFTATATVGGYRRMVYIPYTVVSAPTLTLNLSPTTVARGSTLTLSGKLTAGTTTPQTIYLYYRTPHQTGTWKLATTLTTNAAGAFSIGAPVPMSLPTGMYDLAAFWVNTSNGEYAVSPITVFTVT